MLVHYVPEKKDVGNDHARTRRAKPEVLPIAVGGLHQVAIVGDEQYVGEDGTQHDSGQHLRPVKNGYGVDVREVDTDTHEDDGRNHDVEESGPPRRNGETGLPTEGFRGGETKRGYQDRQGDKTRCDDPE